MFVWKAKNGLTRNPGFEFHDAGRRGTMARLPEGYGNKTKETSFLVKGARIFNSLPIHLRSYGDGEADTPKLKENFKKQLDSFLGGLPDEPNLSAHYSSQMSCIDHKGKKSNSLPFVIPNFVRDSGV